MRAKATPSRYNSLALFDSFEAIIFHCLNFFLEKINEQRYFSNLVCMYLFINHHCNGNGNG